MLDEADVFVQARSSSNLHNDLVSVFLRTLEYFGGIMFLTTNRVGDFDEAILSRISVALKYGPLGQDTRRCLWEEFLMRGSTRKGEAKYTPQDLDWLASKPLNGRQVGCSIVTKNTADRKID